MNKIIHRFQLKVICGVVFLLPALTVPAQYPGLNKHGLQVISTVPQYQKTVQHNVSKTMVDLKKKLPGIVLDLRYAGRNNFMHQQLYPLINTTYLRQPVADKLAIIQKELNEKGKGLKIYDAYRPYAITEKLWESVKNDLYAASPKKGSGHNRGIAIDLTIIDLKTGKELDMGTDFDNFSDTAHHAFRKLPPDVLRNRYLLRSTMEKYSFKASHTEWWHYSLHYPNKFDILDIPFEELEKLNL